MEETLKLIAEQIEWYTKHSSNATIDQILDSRDKLAGYSYHLATLAADLKIEYNSTYFIKTINVAKTQQALMIKGSGLGQAKLDAILKHQEAYNAQIEAEADAYRADILLKSVYKVLDARSQRISVLKQEREQTRNQ